MKIHFVYLIISIILILTSIFRFNYIVDSLSCRHGCIPIIAILLFILGIIFLVLSIIVFFKHKKSKYDKK